MAKAKVKWDRQAGSDQAKALREAAKQRYGGLTAREYRAANSRFKNADPNYRKGSFIVTSLYYGHAQGQEAPVKTLTEAMAHYAATVKNRNALVVKVIELVKNAEGETVRKVLHQYHNTNMQFINSKKEIIYRVEGSNTLLTEKGVVKNQVPYSKLEVARVIYTDGSPWWDSSRERTMH